MSNWVMLKQGHKVLMDDFVNMASPPIMTVAMAAVLQAMNYCMTCLVMDLDSETIDHITVIQ